MFPIRADRLSLAEIAELWAEEMKPSRPAHEIQLAMEKAFWGGEFECDGPSRMDMLPLWVTVNSDSDPDSWDEEERLEVFNKVADWWPSANCLGILED